MMITLHAAIIEWSDDSMDPHLAVGATVEEVRAAIRSEIEAVYDGSMDDAVDDFVSGPGLGIEDWETWHSTMHDIDGTPWVTFFERDVVIPIAVRRG
jgi:hypothetical protein